MQNRWQYTNILVSVSIDLHPTSTNRELATCKVYSWRRFPTVRNVLICHVAQADSDVKQSAHSPNCVLSIGHWFRPEFVLIRTRYVHPSCFASPSHWQAFAHRHYRGIVGLGTFFPLVWSLLIRIAAGEKVEEAYAFIAQYVCHLCFYIF
jgi:hypothetical protein